MAFTVYKLLGADDAPLYVGCTKDIERRLAQHAGEKEWWPEVARVTAKAFDDADDAAQTELSLIGALRPPHNKVAGVSYKARLSAGVEIDAERLKELRRQRVLTIERLAEMAGVSKNTISKGERGGSIYPASIHKIARALGVEPSELAPRE